MDLLIVRNRVVTQNHRQESQSQVVPFYLDWYRNEIDSLFVGCKGIDNQIQVGMVT